MATTYHIMEKLSKLVIFDQKFQNNKINPLRHCRIEKPCGPKSNDEDCKKPWIISDFYKTVNANLTEKHTLLTHSLDSEEKFEVRIEEFDAKSEDDVKLATIDDFQ